MNEQEHKQRHAELHKALDELVTDFITATSASFKGLRGTSVLELMQWSGNQAEGPDHEVRGEGTEEKK